MDEKVTLCVVRKAQIRDGAPPLPFVDPSNIVTLTPQKRAALLGNPLSHEEDDPVQIVGLKGNTAIGRLDLLAGEVNVGMQSMPMLWTSALFVPEEHRNSLVGVLAIIKMQQLCDTVGACGVSQLALPVFEKLKWIKFTLPRYLLLRRSRPVV